MDPSQASLSWHLIRQLCSALNATLTKDLSETHAEVTIAFADTVDSTVVSISGLDFGRHEMARSGDSRFLAGSQVLVVATHRDVRNCVRDAPRGLDMMVDYVGSVEAAVEFCQAGLPQALLFQSDQAGAAMSALRNQVRRLAPCFPFIALLPTGRLVERIGEGAERTCQVGLDALSKTLPSVLVEEISHSL